jgi:hypothetical protein
MAETDLLPARAPEPDLQMAWMLLFGFVEKDTHGRLHSKYLEEGSPEEQDARRALARLLRDRDSRLDRQLRIALADLFDPDPPRPEQRKIKLVARRRGGVRDDTASTQIAESVWSDVVGGKGVTAAINDTADKFHITDETAKKIWAKFRPLLEQVYGPLPGRRRK